MPIIRKIIEVAKSSRAVILPKSWLTYFETREGGPIDKVEIPANEQKADSTNLLIDDNVGRQGADGEQ